MTALPKIRSSLRGSQYLDLCMLLGLEDQCIAAITLVDWVSLFFLTPTKNISFAKTASLRIMNIQRNFK